MAAVVAFEDFQRFGVLPRAGGTFDQPDDLMAELRIVADQVRLVENEKQAQANRQHTRRFPRGR